MTYHHDPSHPLATAYPYFPPEEQAWLQSELAEIVNGILSAGPRGEKFEREFSRYCGAEFGVAFPSCTASLEASLTALGVRPGQEVLVPAETFIATGMAVHNVGARPVFVEVSRRNLGLDFEDAFSKITDRTAGAIVVHFGGFIAADLEEFIAEMHRRGLFVIEDAAHAHGAELRGKRSGCMGDVGCFSFFPTKIMTTGEGGVAVTSRAEIAKVLRSLQHRGRDMNAPDERYVLPGRNNRFTEIAAAMGLSQLRSLPSFLDARREVGRTYDRMLAGSPYFEPLRAEEGCIPSYWRYVVFGKRPLPRAEIQQALKQDRISVDWAYAPLLHLQPVMRTLFGTKEGDLPLSEGLLGNHLCLPVHARMRACDAEYVVERLHAHMEEIMSGGNA